MGKLTVRKRYAVRKSKLSEIYKKLEATIGKSAELFKSDMVEVAELSGGEIVVYLLDKKPHLMEVNGNIFPTLRGAVEKPFDKRRIVVDTGAIPFMVKGADLMRPGVLEISYDVKKDEPVVIVDANHKKPLAIGIALLEADEMQSAQSGKVAKNIHYVGDDLWNLEI
ncbi:RNA-binding protein [Methanomicrobium mobile]|uniref:RNA-binding protein n=1 Tax=Methanomicrobium mobile TaxID=2205 RepID=UPI0005B26F29|nr:RNA-binding protein [Methanomicrobium mobile]